MLFGTFFSRLRVEGIALPELLAHEVGILLDVHDGGKTKGAFVEGLAKVCAQHTSQDSSVDCPEKLLACLVVNIDRLSISISVGLWGVLAECYLHKEYMVVKSSPSPTSPSTLPFYD